MQAARRVEGLSEAAERVAIRRLALRVGVPDTALAHLVAGVREIHATFGRDGSALPRSYRNLVARTGLSLKAALWIVSGARSQGDFRRFFGSRSHELPPKSVAWQLYHDLFGDVPVREPALACAGDGATVERFPVEQSEIPRPGMAAVGGVR